MKASKTVAFFTILLVSLLVFLINMTYAPKLSPGVLMIVRIVFIILFFIAWRVFGRRGLVHYKNFTFILFVINLAFLTVSFFTAELWNLDLESAKGIAIAKFSDGFIISVVIILSLALAGFKMKDLYLTSGKVITGLIIGVFSFAFMAFPAFYNPDLQLAPGFLHDNILWILLFVFANGFMEELLFRGIFLKQINNFVKSRWSILLTSIVFGVGHFQVTYTPDVLIFVSIVFLLGLIWGFLMHYTRSIIASVFFHAGADLMIIVPAFAGSGLNG